MPYADITLVVLKELLSAVFSNKDSKVGADEGEHKAPKLFPSVKLTEKEILAYEKAGMPSPLNKWLYTFRKAGR